MNNDIRLKKDDSKSMSSINIEREEASKRIQTDIDKFIENGGKIKTISSDVMQSVAYKSVGKGKFKQI